MTTAHVEVVVRRDGTLDQSRSGPPVAVPVAPAVAGARPEPAVLLPGVDLAALLADGRFAAAAGEVLVVPAGAVGPRSVYLFGVGDRSAAALRKAGAALGRRAREEPALVVPAAADGLGQQAPSLVEGLVLAGYRYRVPGAEPKPALRLVELRTDGDPAEAELRRAAARAEATLLARDLANTPSLEKSPQWLAEEAGRIAGASGLVLRVRDEHALAREGFGGIVAVGMGSTRPPRLLELSYAPRGASRHVVLVGKGITFDSGGLSLKPNDGMVAMKTDMAGGAAVLAAMSALRTLEVRVRVSGLVAAAENLPSGTAQRPGDVIRHYGGRTSEVLNTDAEGRLVLADALAYAVRRLRPDAVVDLATLTGAATLGLGRRHAALFSPDDALAAELVAAGEAAGERVWRMPLVEDYRPALDSPVADLSNVARDAKFSGGAIMAALFLREFVDDAPWAHLDIAGPARAEAEEDGVPKGATGYGARLLLRWLEGTG